MSAEHKNKQAQLRYFGAPEMTAGGLDVIAFHLHRYVNGWLKKNRRANLLITIGFEGSFSESATVSVGTRGSEAVRVGWTFEDLCHTFRYGDGKLRIEQRGAQAGDIVFDTMPVFDRSAFQSQDEHFTTERVLLGFVLAPANDPVVPEAFAELQEQVAEAIRAARRNALRLFFDEQRALPMKTFLYELLAHFPEWMGCDHSASMILTSSLDAMTLESSESARFGILAERMFFPQCAPGSERLVGMMLDFADHEPGILHAAVQRQRQNPELAYQCFYRRDAYGNEWFASDDPDSSLKHLHHFHAREAEAMIVLVPLLVCEGHETALLGFVCLMYRSQIELPSSVSELFVELRDHLAAMLRFSSLYTLSARNLWILSHTRRALEVALSGCAPEMQRLENLIGEVSALVARHVDVPGFAIAYVSREGDESTRSLKYVHPHGWKHYEHQSLALDVEPEKQVESGVSGLAVRLGRPLVLAGGHGEGDSFAFKNYLYVHEESARIVDARSHYSNEICETSGWVRLGDYYRPARASAYATLAYPISFAGETLGVVTIEVDKSTNWLWWTGFGGQFFWQMIAEELGYAFYILLK